MSIDKKMLFRITLLVISSASVNGLSTLKIWVVNTDLTIGSRYWDTLVTIGKFTFNGTMTSALALPTTMDDSEEYCELLYPLDKLSAISNDQSNDTVEGSCVDEELLSKMDRVFWIDPRNWNTSSFDYNKAVPHIERIPCNFDRVRIPNTTSTFIILPSKPVTLTSLRFGSLILTPSTLKRYSTNEYFMRHFILKSSLGLTDVFNVSMFSYGCEERTGCECGTSAYEDEICAFIKDDCPKESSCKSPIKPRGHCCSLCGAFVTVWFKKDIFVYKKLEPVVQKFIESQAQEASVKITWYMSKVSRRTLQIVVLPEDEYSTELVDVAIGLCTYLEKTSNLGIDSCWAQNSGNVMGGQRGWSTMVKIFIGLGAVLIIGIALVCLKKSKFIENMVPFFKASIYKQVIDDKNSLNKYNITKTTKEEMNNIQVQDEKVEETEPTNQPEQISDLIDTSD